MSFFRHEEIYQSDAGRNNGGERPKDRPRLIVYPRDAGATIWRRTATKT